MAPITGEMRGSAGQVLAHDKETIPQLRRQQYLDCQTESAQSIIFNKACQ